jgi:hypothetical protein
MKNLLRSGLMALLVSSAIATKAQVPVLSSYPSASAVIFLDFDGHLVNGTSWNYNGPIDCGGSGMTTTAITEVFNRVAEDYRPFNINVTTDSTKFLAVASNRRMRVIMTVSSSWYGVSGGVAFVGSFAWGDDNPCFVFTQLHNFSVKNISEAASHEAGHTLGLYHQAVYDANCIKTSDYNTGVGSGEIGWAPIMGVGYYRNFTLWNNGPNSMGCNQFQSDLDIITTLNGFSYRNDDHANTFAAASLANFTSNQFAISGVVERNTDIDLVKFIMPAEGRFELEAVPYNVGTGNAGSDLDMQVTLYNSTQTSLSEYNPGTLLSSVIDTVLNAGTYYLRIEGKGNLYAPAYASLGSYSLQGRFTTGGVLPLHKLDLRGAITGDKHSFNWDIVADEQIIELSLEVSTDGRTFSRLVQTGNDIRSYIYRPSINSNAQYRVNVMFDNGRRYYSNIVTLRKNNSADRPFLLGNIITGSTIQVSSPGKYSYMLYDMNGKILGKGQLVNGTNTINAGNLLNGMYLIRFAGDDQQWTDKLIRH